MLERKKYPGKNRGNEHSNEHSRAVFHATIGAGAKRVGKYLGLFLLLFTGPCLAITEAQFIQKVLAQDKLLEEAQIGLDIKQIELDASRDNYQNWKATISFDTSYNYRDRDRNTASTRDYTSQTRKYPKELGLDIDKRFLSHPGSLQLGISRRQEQGTEEETDVPTKTQASKGRGDILISHPVREYETDHYIQFRYPLLKRDSNATSLKTHHRDIIDLQRQKLSFFETKEDFLEDRLQDYLSWVYLQKQDRIEQEFLRQLRQLQPEDEAGAALLKSTIYQTENDNSDTRIRLQAIKEKLAVLLDDKSIVMETAEFDLQKRAHLVGGNVPDYLHATNRDLQRITLNIDLSRLEIAHFQNQRLPELDITLRAEQNSHRGNTQTSDINDDRINYLANLEFSYPLGGNITNRTNLEKSLLGVRRLEISYQDKLQDLLADIQLLNIRLTLDENQLLDAIDAATQSAQIEYENHQSGQTSFRDLLQAYHEVRIAKLDHIENVIDYQTNSLGYDNLLDRIIKSPCQTPLSDCKF